MNFFGFTSEYKIIDFFNADVDIVVSVINNLNTIINPVLIWFNLN